MSHDSNDEVFLDASGNPVKSPVAVNKLKRDRENPRPKHDYTNWPEKDHDGVRGISGHVLTQGLFVEMAKWPYKTDPIYTMKPTEVYDQNLKKWLPSARQIFVQAPTEYDAIRRLVGSLHQWEQLMKLKWFVEGDSYIGFDGVNEWRREADMRRQAEAHKLLMSAAADGDIGAAKALFHAANKNPRGRPMKRTGAILEAPVGDVEDDFERIQAAKVVNLRD